jgi:predicted GTPase
MTYTVEINMKKVKKKLIDSGVKTHLKPIVTVSVEASTPDEACANAIDKVLKEIKENKETAKVVQLVKDIRHEISVVKVRQR